jgi:hypothetical protein
MNRGAYGGEAARGETPGMGYGHGGGFDSVAGTSGMANHFNPSQITGHNPSTMGSANGFGSIAGNQERMGGMNANSFTKNTTVNNFGHNDLSNANVNNYHSYANNAYHPYSASAYHPYGASAYHPYGASAYHPYGASAYHPYGAYGYHPYGAYGYHPYGGVYGYPGGWYNPGFMEATMWTCMGMSTLSSFLGLAALSSKGSQSAPTTNITYAGGNTYINGVPSTQYYQQAQQLAATAPLAPPAAPYAATSAMMPAVTSQFASTAGLGPGAAAPSAAPGLVPTAVPGVVTDTTPGGLAAVTPSQLPQTTATVPERWEPLGVFSLVEPGQTKSTTLFQLAINKDGIVRGNYVNEITNERTQVHGALDKATQRISWTVGDNPETVFSSVLSDLTKDKCKVLVQFGPNNTQQMAFQRMPPPKQSDSTSPTEAS